MKIIGKTGTEELAYVYLAETDSGNHIEFVESIQPPFTMKEKWILMVSMLFGCPGKCKFCDAGGNYQGKLSFEQIMFQIDYMIQNTWIDPGLRGELYPTYELIFISPNNYHNFTHPWHTNLDNITEEIWNYGNVAKLFQFTI